MPIPPRQVSFVVPANACDGESCPHCSRAPAGTSSHSVPLTLTVTAAADFSISASPSSVSAQAGTDQRSGNGFRHRVEWVFRVCFSQRERAPAGAVCSPSCPPHHQCQCLRTGGVCSSGQCGDWQRCPHGQGTSGNLSHNAPVTLGVTAASPDFSISVSPSSVSTQMGTTSAPVTVSVTGLNGFSGSVSVAVSGLPAGIVCSPSCPLTINANASAQVSFVVPANATIGNLALTAQGTSGNLSHSAPLTLGVTTSLNGICGRVSVRDAPVSGTCLFPVGRFESIPLSKVTVLVDNSPVATAVLWYPAS